ncbi:hypothetical protein FGO68_gene13820 [Halteria grandinella]|uniref:Transmembrane protein n=1 Tax=Halteria grandinella TaxID=5974 RepID=A0A8J8NQS0_HALGN|nr:hypothetical protein FGO68_gene13820 [Halteria grandinella]
MKNPLIRAFDYTAGELAQSNTTVIEPYQSIFDTTVFKVVSIIETAGILAIYVAVMVHVLYHVGLKLDKSAYITIVLFLASEICALIFYSINAAGNPLGGIPDTITQSVLYCVLFYYAYQMQIVRIKLESETPEKYQQRRKQAYWFWVSFYIALAIFTFLEIDENITLIHQEFRQQAWLKVVIIMARITCLYLECSLAYLQWSLYLYFIRLKSTKRNEAVLQTGQDFSSKKTQKLTTCWIITVLTINTIDLIAYTIIQFLIALAAFKGDNNRIYEIWCFVCIFWVDILCLTNGLCFLMVFKQMAQHSVRAKGVRKYYSAETAQGFGNNEDLKVEASAERWKRKNYGTASIKKLLENGSQSGAGSSINKTEEEEEEDSIDAVTDYHKGSIKSQFPGGSDSNSSNSGQRRVIERQMPNQQLDQWLTTEDNTTSRATSFITGDENQFQAFMIHQFVQHKYADAFNQFSNFKFHQPIGVGQPGLNVSNPNSFIGGSVKKMPITVVKENHEKAKESLDELTDSLVENPKVKRTNTAQSASFQEIE